MAHLHCEHDETVDASGNLLSYTDASADFGSGAVAVSCPCGSWIVEDGSGMILAASSPAGAAEITALLAA